ncbi:MAG: hypothetical protein JNL88_00415 [Bacteroidia bacterium]|nr:hypothetical protein [Bacteroidia bacterium]
MKIASFLLLSAALLFSCGNPASDKTSTPGIPSAEEKHTHHDEETDIRLNKGEKWKVDEPMMVHIRNMENSANTFRGSSLSEYRTLGESLQGGIDQLTSNCTMEGQAHDELHKWLLPFIDLVDVFINSKTEQEAGAGLEEIKKSFAEFNQYFR